MKKGITTKYVEITLKTQKKIDELQLSYYLQINILQVRRAE